MKEPTLLLLSTLPDTVLLRNPLNLTMAQFRLTYTRTMKLPIWQMWM